MHTLLPGLLLVALVREFLEWSGMEFTAKVYEPEMGPAADYRGRMDLVRQLVGRGFDGKLVGEAALEVSGTVCFPPNAAGVQGVADHAPLHRNVCRVCRARPHLIPHYC